MSITLTTLTSVAECDAIVGEASREKTSLVNRKNVLAERLAADVDTADVSRMLDYYPEKLVGLRAMLALNPPEEEARKLNIQIADTMKAQVVHERRMVQFGPHWKLLLEMEIEECDSLIAVKENQIALIESHKATLPPDAVAA